LQNDADESGSENDILLIKSAKYMIKKTCDSIQIAGFFLTQTKSVVSCQLID